LPPLKETLELSKSKLGADRPKTLLSMNNLAVGYRNAGKLELALPLFEQLLPLQEKKLGPRHPDTLLTVANLGMTYKEAGRLA